MTLQFIQDIKGNTTGVYIPIEEWENLKAKYEGLQLEEINNSAPLTSWQKEIIDDRLKDYYNNSSQVDDFDKTIKDVLNEL